MVSAASSRPRSERSLPDPDVLETFERRIRALGAQDTTEGALILLLAGRWAEGGHSVSAEIALSKAIREALGALEIKHQAEADSRASGLDSLLHDLAVR
jgi:hypothetical protein